MLRDCVVAALLAMTLFVCHCEAAGKPPKQSPYQEARFIMGTVCEVKVFDLGREESRATAEKAFAALNRIDELMSSYKETSEVSRINREAHRAPVAVSDETFFVLERALEISRESDGAFDVTVGPLVRLWGFFRKEGQRVPTTEEIEEARARCGYKKVILDPQKKTVRLTQEGMEIDLGGIAKGYAVDLALDALRREGIARASVNTGGQYGFLGLPAPGKKWQVAIEDPKNSGTVSKMIEVGEEAVSTSANTENYFEVAGKRYGHILDPHTGWPIETNTLSVTVVAKTGLETDALDTALFVMGPEKGKKLAEKRGAKAVFIQGNLVDETATRR